MDEDTIHRPPADNPEGSPDPASDADARAVAVDSSSVPAPFDAFEEDRGSWWANQDFSPIPEGSILASEEPAPFGGGSSIADPDSEESVCSPGVSEDPSVADVLDGEEDAPGRDSQERRALGIRLRKAGQVFFFPDQEHTVRIGSKVVVSLEHGPSLGEVVSVIYGDHFEAQNEDGTRMQGAVLGLATAQDIAQHTENSILSAEAAAFCKTCIRQRGLDMKLVDVEVLHDRSKIIFFFTAPSRIDFRELVKDLVRNYRTRIELRQIGVRHETQMIGGLGNCGMVCCCHKYLRRFAPVTIKMAKEQNLFLNPAKLSGMCGRLLCCLSFEQSNYEEFNRRCPKLGKKYTTSKGTMKVLRANMFSQSIAILTESGEEVEMPLEEWEALEPHRAEPPGPEQQRAAAQRADGGRKNGPRRDRRDEGAGQDQDAVDAVELLQDSEPDDAARQPRHGHNPGQAPKPRKKRRQDS